MPIPEETEIPLPVSQYSNPRETDFGLAQVHNLALQYLLFLRKGITTIGQTKTHIYTYSQSAISLVRKKKQGEKVYLPNTIAPLWPLRFSLGYKINFALPNAFPVVLYNVYFKHVHKSVSKWSRDLLS